MTPKTIPAIAPAPIPDDFVVATAVDEAGFVASTELVETMRLEFEERAMYSFHQDTTMLSVA